ncbi:MAG: hypothetical protein AABX11_00840 [Nanoarchaeota archaeon]
MESNAVTYSPGIWTFDLGNRTGSLLQALLHPMTQEESAKQTFYDGFHSASLTELFSIWGKMFELRNSDDKEVKNAVESARQFVQRETGRNLLNTQSRIAYQPIPTLTDKIIHGYGTSRPFVNEVGFIGRDGKTQEVLLLEQSLALTGKNPDEVGIIMSYLTETPEEVGTIKGYLNKTHTSCTWRVNQQPTNVDERVVRLYAFLGGFGLDCSGDLDYEGASFGVRFTEKNLGDKK